MHNKNGRGNLFVVFVLYFVLLLGCTRPKLIAISYKDIVFEPWIINSDQGKTIKASQIMDRITNARKHGYTLKNIQIEDSSLARASGMGSNVEVTLIKAGNFTANILLYHPGYSYYLTIEEAKFEVRLPTFSFNKLSIGRSKAKTVSTDEILAQIPEDPKSKDYELKSITVNNANYASVTSSKPNLGLKPLRSGEFTADIVLAHANYFDVTIRGAEFQVKSPGFTFNKLLRRFGDGKTISADKILGQIPEDPKSKGYKLKSITVNDSNYARVTGSKPNLGLELLKGGSFTVDIVLEHAVYLDFGIDNAKFEVKLPSFSFNRFVRDAKDSKIISTNEILGRIPEDPKSQGYSLKSIIVGDASRARVRGTKPDLEVEFLGDVSFTADIVLEHSNYFDVTIKGARFASISTLDKTYGGSSNDWANGIIEGSDGSLWVVGTRRTTGSGGGARVLNIEKDGSVLLDKTYGSSLYGQGRSIIESSDGSLWVAGVREESTGDPGNIWVLNLSKDGSILLDKTYGGVGIDRALGIIEDSDGSLWVVGHAGSSTSGTSTIQILKLNKDGSVILESTYGGGGSNSATSVIESRDGSIWVTGYTNGVSTISDIWVLNLRKNGSVLLEKTYRGRGDDYPQSITEDSDGNIWLACTTTEGKIYRSRVLNLSKDGSILLDKTYGSGPNSASVFSIIEASDGSIWAAGWTVIKGARTTDALVLNLSKDGSVLSEKTYGGSSYDYAYSIIEGSGGNIWVAGSTQSKGAGGSDIWVLGIPK